MKAIILAAGLGSRLLPLTADRPKCLVPAGDRAILEHQLHALQASGVGDVTVVGGYRFDRLEAFVETLADELRPKLLFNPFFAVSSSIGSVWAARDLLDGPFLLLNGDTIYEAEPLAAAIATLPEGVSLFIEPSHDAQHDDMRVRAECGRVLEVGKGLEQTGHRSLGIVASTNADGGAYRSALDEVISAPGGEHRFHHDVVDLLARRLKVSAVEVEPGSWQEVDSIGDIDRWLGIADNEAA